MGKAPSFQFYPSDWMRDLTEHPLEIEGAWIRICCALFWSETKGTSDKTLTKWARILRVGERKCQTIIAYLDNHNIADVINQNGSIQITSRRMVKDEYIRKVRKFAGLQGGNPQLKSLSEKGNLVKQALLNQKTLSSSSSSSSSSDLKDIGTKTQKPRFVPPSLEDVKAYCIERRNAGKEPVDPERWFNYYVSNGWRVGRNSMKNWKAAVHTWEKSDGLQGGSGRGARSGGAKSFFERDVEEAERIRQKTRARFGFSGRSPGLHSGKNGEEVSDSGRETARSDGPGSASKVETPKA